MLATVRRSLSCAAAVTAVVLALMILLATAPPLATRADALTVPQGERVVEIAASKGGAPYRYGADRPRYFDCSGFTKWVFARLGRRLPHSAALQSARVRHEPASVGAVTCVLLVGRAGLPRGHLRRPQQRLARTAAG
jgi:cell wall-associated NlpC family hydrolase